MLRAKDKSKRSSVIIASATKGRETGEEKIKEVAKQEAVRKAAVIANRENAITFSVVLSVGRREMGRIELRKSYWDPLNIIASELILKCAFVWFVICIKAFFQFCLRFRDI